MRYLAVLLACGIYLFTPATNAAGFGLNEHSADAMASAYAGSAATGVDASYLAYNPATLSEVKQFDASFTATGISAPSSADYPYATTSAGTPTGGNNAPKSFVMSAVVPELGFRQALTDRVAVGLVVFTPWGLTTSYPDTWAGRYYAEKTRLLTINAMPTVSYRLTRGLAVGGGLQIEYAEGTLTSAIDMGTLGATLSIPGSSPGAQDGQAVFRAHSWALGFTIGVVVQANDRLRIGLSYRSSVHHVLRGPLQFTLDSAGIGQALQSAAGLFVNSTARTTINTPDVVRLGAIYDLAPRWRLLAEADWTNWHRFHQLEVNAANTPQPPDITAADWRDGWFGSLGVDYQVDNDWHMRAGTGYDSSPIPQATLNPRIPDANRLWAAIGSRYDLNRNITLSVTLARLFNSNEMITLMPTSTGNALRGSLTGTTRSAANVVGLEVSYRTL